MQGQTGDIQKRSLARPSEDEVGAAVFVLAMSSFLVRLLRGLHGRLPGVNGGVQVVAASFIDHLLFKCKIDDLVKPLEHLLVFSRANLAQKIGDVSLMDTFRKRGILITAHGGIDPANSF